MRARYASRNSLPSIAEVYAQATGQSLERVGRRVNDEIVAPCPASGHKDRNPSCSINVIKSVFCCHACGASGGVLDLWVHAGLAANRSEAVVGLRRQGLMP